jgi:hypothetical protein
MTTQLTAGVLLVLLPIAYNVLFEVLRRTFDYPDILRRPTSEVLARFAGGGNRLVLTWWAFSMTALLLTPAAVLVSSTFADANATVLVAGTALGVVASVVQVLGLIRWPFAVPHLARVAADPAASPEAHAAVDVVFQSFNRYLGVAVGEHLGYLLTGAWTAFAGVGIVQSDVLHPAFGVVALVIAPLFVLGSLEFVGPFERDGWRPAAALVPVVYVAWSLWLLALGVALIVTA